MKAKCSISKDSPNSDVLLLFVEVRILYKHIYMRGYGKDNELYEELTNEQLTNVVR